IGTAVAEKSCRRVSCQGHTLLESTQVACYLILGKFDPSGRKIQTCGSLHTATLGAEARTTETLMPPKKWPNSFIRRWPHPRYSWARLATDRWALPLLTLRVRHTWDHESPSRRSAATRRASTCARGRPNFFPFALAFRRPARTRSCMR